ncbi:MAG: FAD-dependent oxidoreductase [Ramlibacter sp.]
MQDDNRDPALRRRLLQLAATGALGALLPLSGSGREREDEDEDDDKPRTFALARTGLKGHVVVVGGGMAGATAAKYLRLWGGSGLRVTLVEADAWYTSNIMSNLVLNGSRSVGSLRYTHADLEAKYGIVRRRAALTGIAVGDSRITLSDGSSLAYDRLVLAPGVEFEDAYGLSGSDYASKTPHAWRAGPQTDLLRRQLAGMRAGGTFVMTIPRAPYRCPPGPYERACVVADFLSRHKGPAAKVVVLDENPGIQAEVHNFTRAFQVIHAGVVDYQPGATGIVIDPDSKVVRYVDALGTPRVVQAEVVNPIPPHRAAGSGAGGWLAAAGLANGVNGRWAKVDVLSYASTAPGASAIHVLGDAAQSGLPKAGHVANQEAKICADAIVRLLGGGQPDPAPVGTPPATRPSPRPRPRG